MAIVRGIFGWLAVMLAAVALVAGMSALIAAMNAPAIVLLAPDAAIVWPLLTCSVSSWLSLTCAGVVMACYFGEE